MIKKAPSEIWDEYQKGMDYKYSVGLYDTVTQNENFFIGKQWEGVNAPDLDKPVFNMLKRVITYFISMIVTDDIAAQVSAFNAVAEEGDATFKIINKQVDEIIENDGIKSKNRKILRNAAVDGDACFYVYFDPDEDIGQLTKGTIKTEIIDNTYVFFGNQQIANVQQQPYIILAMRKMVDSVKDEAKGNGVAPDDIESIVADNDPQEINADQTQSDKVTELVKLWKENGTIHAIKATRNVTVKKEWDTKYKLYPVAYMSWDDVKNSCHGQAAITGLIPNQIFVNKIFAMAMQCVKMMAFPKIAYNTAMFPNGFSNTVGEAIGVNGDPNAMLFKVNEGAEMPDQVLELIDKTIEYTKDFLGASDASLGNVTPDNTSAIIAVQKSSAMPLELQKLSFYQFVEDYIRIFIDIMRVDYGLRQVVYADPDGNDVPTQFDFSVLDKLHLQLNVDIGASAYWSELMQVQTMDNLFDKGIITDAITYLEGIPGGYLNNKNAIIQKLKEKQELQAQALLSQTQQPGAPAAQNPQPAANVQQGVRP